MATTYLELTNELLREANEVLLTSSNFATAVGIQAHCKDMLNKAYFDMVNEEPQWPFLSLADSGTIDPMLGNTFIETVAGTRFYELKPASSSIITDYGYIDWDHFYLTTVGVSGETAPFVSKNLNYITLETYKDYFRVGENSDDADTQNFGEPLRVIKSPDNRMFGLSPIPDKIYRVFFTAYVLPTALSSHSDTVVFPELYTTVLLNRARYYMHQFKDNSQAAAFAMEDYKKGLRNMKLNLMSPAPMYMKDDRRVFY